MSLSITQKINDFDDADFKLSLAKGTPKNSYLASGADYYVPQNPQVASKADKNSSTASALYFIASALGLVAICAFMPEVRLKLSDFESFKDFDNLHKLEKSDKFLGKLKLGFMKTIDFISDKVMLIRTSFKARKM